MVARCGQCGQGLRVPGPVAQPVPPPIPLVRTPRRRPPPKGRRTVLVAAIVTGAFALAGLAGSAYYLWREPPHIPRPEPRFPPEKRGEAARGEPQEKNDPGAAKQEKKDPQPPNSQTETARLTTPLVEAINRQRQHEGVPVLTLHEGHSRGCLDHARYLARHPVAADDDPHDQEPSADGATEAGRQAARVASVVRGSPEQALRKWLSAPVHRALLTYPRLRSVGIGVAATPAGEPVAVFDFARGGPQPTPPGGREPVLYPAPGQAGVPLAFPGNEVPDPLPMSADKLAGYPITVIFPPSARVHDARGWLEDEAGQDVPVWLSSPARPANDRFARNQQNTVCLIAREMLRPGTRYAVYVEASVDGKGWARAWTFATGAAGEWQRRIRAHVLPRLNLYRRVAGLGPVTLDEGLSRGCAAHARYLTRNVGRVEGLQLHEEKPELPGFTEEGRRVARGTANFQGLGVEPAGVVEQMLSTVRFRPVVLNPHEDRVGLGADLHSPGGWYWVVYLPPVRSRGPGPTGIVFPAPGQREVPLVLGEPVANLVKGQPADARAGFPVTAAFSLSQKVREVKATLREKDGDEVPCWLSTPEKPLPGAGPFRQIAMIPKGPLATARTYTAAVTAEVDGEPWSRRWSFTTVDPKGEEERVAAVLLRRLNAVRAQAGLGAVTLDETLSRGCGLHAAYVVRNLENPKVGGIAIHDEDSSLPGYTREGARAGAASVIALAPDAAESVDSWMATLYHRLPLLDPRMKRIGYGQAPHPTRGWATVLDAGSGR
jgi:uncharacterized protein YkwD